MILLGALGVGVGLVVVGDRMEGVRGVSFCRSVRLAMSRRENW